jgi:recombinational DNA repair protein RecR
MIRNVKKARGKMSIKMCNECRRCDGDQCTYFDNYSDRESTIACILFEPKNPTLFDRITASPEVLAPHFVFLKAVIVTNINPQQQWLSTLKGDVYPTREEALAATLEELNKVSK